MIIPFYRIGYEGLERIEEGLKLTESLVHLDLSHCNLNDRSGILIADALTTNEKLKVSGTVLAIRKSLTNLVCPEFRCLTQMNLNYLNLSHNHLHIYSGKEIGKMLETNIGLKTLILGWNKLYPEEGERMPATYLVSFASVYVFQSASFR